MVAVCVFTAGPGGLAFAQQATSVEVVKPEQRPLIRTLMVPGTLMPDEQVDLLAKTSGYVGEINVDIGSRVSKGEVLVEISVPEMADELRQAEAILKAKRARVRALQAQVAQAERRVATARAQVQRFSAENNLGQINLKRQQELHEGRAIPDQALDEARAAQAVTEARLRIAEAEVAGAEAQHQAVQADVEVAQSQVMVSEADLGRLKTLMDYAVIKAPFDGVITVRGVDHGTFVRSAVEGITEPLLRIAKTDRIRVVIEVPESEVPFVAVGTKVLIDVKAVGDEPVASQVSRTAGALNPSTRTMRVEVDLDNSDGRFAPGMFAHVTVQLQARAQAMFIPSKAIRVVGKQMVVLVAANGVARAVPVEVGYDDGISAEILSGLDEAAQVITSTSGAVSSGVAVTAVLSES